jgi:hypothetical protein
LHFDTPHGKSSGASTLSSDYGGLRSFDSNHTPLSNGSIGLSTAHVDSWADAAVAAPTYAHSRFHGVPEPGSLELDDAHLPVLNTTSSPNGASSLLNSQSLLSDDVEAKRKILAEVRFRRNCVPYCFNSTKRQHFPHTLPSQVRRKIEQKQVDRRKRQEESMR